MYNYFNIINNFTLEAEIKFKKEQRTVKSKPIKKNLGFYLNPLLKFRMNK